MPRIVVLDGHTLNPGDLSWDALSGLGELVVHARTPKEQIVETSLGADLLLTNKTPLSAETLARLPDLRYIGVLATGFNIVEVEAARERGITVCNVPAYSTMSVAQLVFAFILEHCHHVGRHSDQVRSGEWSAAKDFSFWNSPLIELEGKTLGIVGFGNIGAAVARIAQAFGMKVLATSRTPKQAYDVEFVPLERLAREADFVSLHVPLTPETQGLVSKAFLEKMKPTAFLINTGRGPLVNEAELAQALNEGRIAGAGLDVLSAEPPSADNPLLTAKNCLVTPHIAWATESARRRLMDVTVENVRAFLAGKPQNVVS